MWTTFLPTDRTAPSAAVMALDHDTSLSRPGAATESPQEDVVALVDGRAISPRGTRTIEGTRPTVEERTTSPGLASPPVRIPEVTECLGPDHSIRKGLVGEQPDRKSV